MYTRKGAVITNAHNLIEINNQYGMDVARPFDINDS